MQAYKKIKALGTEVEFYLQSDDPRDLDNDLLILEKLVVNFEHSFSRFIPVSELNLFNQASSPFIASAALIDILSLAHNFYQITDGIFNPTILPNLEMIGYDQSFDLISGRGEIKKSITEIKKSDFNLVSLDIAHNLITKPVDLKIDLGGIGKGYIVDLLAKHLIVKGYKNFWISAGGDMYLSGVTEEKTSYQVGLQNPLKLDHDIANLLVIDNQLAVATSGISKRNWQINSKTYNHVIDPRTGISVDNDLLSVTVVADQASRADVFSKTVLILGKEQGLAFINHQPNCEALIIDKNLEFTLSNNINKYLIKKNA